MDDRELTRRSLLATAGGVATAAVAGGRADAQAGGADGVAWPTACRTPANDLYLPDRTGPRSALRERFRVPLAADATPAPAVQGGRAYVGDGSPDVYAVDLSTGDVVWRQGLDIGIAGTPAVVDGSMYVVTTDGRIYAMDPATGEHSYLGHVPNDPSDDTEVRTGPTVLDGTLLVRQGREIHAIDLASGEQRFAVTSRYTARTHGFAVADGSLVYRDADGALAAVGLSEGTERWSRRPAYDGGRFMQAPVVVDGTVYCGSTHTTPEPANGTVAFHAIDLADGTQRWRHVFEGHNTLDDIYPVVTPDRVFFDTAAFARDGELRRPYSSLNPVEANYAPFDGEFFYDLSRFDDALYVKRSTEQALRNVDRFVLEGIDVGPTTDLVLLDRAILCRSADGPLVCFEQERVPTATPTATATPTQTPTETTAGTTRHTSTDSVRTTAIQTTHSSSVTRAITTTTDGLPTATTGVAPTPSKEGGPLAGLPGGAVPWLGLLAVLGGTGGYLVGRYTRDEDDGA